MPGRTRLLHQENSTQGAPAPRAGPDCPMLAARPATAHVPRKRASKDTDSLADACYEPKSMATGIYHLLGHQKGVHKRRDQRSVTEGNKSRALATWRLNITLLNDPEVERDVTGDTRTQLGMRRTTLWNVWLQGRQGWEGNHLEFANTTKGGRPRVHKTKSDDGWEGTRDGKKMGAEGLERQGSPEQGEQAGQLPSLCVEGIRH